MGGRGWAETTDSGVSGYPLDLENQFAIEFWIKYNASSDADAVVLTKGGTPGKSEGNYMVYLEGKGESRHVQFEFNNFFNNIQSDSSIPAGQWTHVAFTYDGGTQTIYINGKQDTQASTGGSPSKNDSPFLIGVNDAKSGNFLKGQVEDVRVWSTSRNVIEIENNYLIEISGSTSGLAGLWQFNGTLSDSANSNDLGTSGDAKVVSGGAHPLPPFFHTTPRNGSVVLNWKERVGPSGQNNADGFVIYRNGNRLTQLGGSTHSYVDTTVSNNQTYTYQIRANDSTNKLGGYSKTATETPYRLRGGASLDLDGRGWATASDRDSLDLSEDSSPFAIEFWIKYSASSDKDAVVLTKGGIPGKSSGTYMAYLKGTGEAREIKFTFNNFFPHITSDSSIQAGQWTHVAFTYDGSTQTIYINGKKDTQTSTSGTPSTNNSPLYVGVDDSESGHFLNGSVDDLRIWKTSRQKSAVQGDWYHRLTGNETDLSNYWRFNEVGESDKTRSVEEKHEDLELKGDAKIQTGGAYPVAPYINAISRDRQVRTIFANRTSQSIDNIVFYQQTDSTLPDPGFRRGGGLVQLPTNRDVTDSNITNGETYYYYITSRVNGQESDFPRAATATPYNTSGGSALSLETGEYGTVSDRDDADLSQNSEPFTIEFWVKYQASSAQDAVVLTKGGTPGGSSGNYMAYLQGSGEDRQIKFTFNNFFPDITSDSSIQAGQWTHVAFTYDGSTQTIYINGKKDTQTSTSGTPSTNDKPLRVGTDQAATGHNFVGQIDEVRLWRTARTDQEIANNYRSELVDNQPPLALYWRFDDAGLGTALGSGVQHSTMELKNGATLSSPGVFPVPPRAYALGEDTNATVTWQTRTNTSVINVYRSSQRNLGNRAQIANISAGTQGVYIDTGLQNGRTLYYQTTSVDTDGISGQESDFAYPAAALPSSRSAGNAFEFNGQSSYLTVEDGESIELSEDAQPFTIEFWIKYNSNAPADAVVLSRGGTPGQSSGNYMAYLKGTGQNRTVQFEFNNFFNDLSSNTAVRAGQWTHVAFTYDGNTQTIYINGKQDAQANTGGTPNANIDAVLRIGADNPGTGHHFQGQIDEIRLWRTARSASEIGTYYNRELIGDQPAPVGYWRGCHSGKTDKVWGQARRPMTATFTNINCVDSGIGVKTGSVTSKFDVTLDGAPNGLQRYNVSVTTTESALIRSINPKLISGGFQVAAGGAGSTNVTARGADLTQAVGSFSDKRVLFTIEYSGNLSSSDLNVKVNRLVDDSGNTMSASRIGFKSAGGTSGQLFTQALPGSGGQGPPGDPDGDGNYEDVNGDGQTNFDDAIALAFVRDSQLSQAQINAVDRDGDGDVDFDDAIDLAFDPLLA